MSRRRWGLQLTCLGLLIGLSWIYDLGKTARQLPEAILNSTTQEVTPLVDQLQWRWQPIGWIFRQIGTTRMRAVDELISGLPTLLGIYGERHYVVIFQNNMELRPTGGFMGSYADVWLRKGKLVKLEIQDIYVPDGQIKGYVAEPLPIKKYLFNDNHPGWRLRDANWNPDFPSATKAIDWFFKEGGLPLVDGYIAVNLNLIVSVLDKTGAISLSDYDGLIITAESFYGEAQRQAEEDFFPGSTQKRDFLGSVSRQIMSRLTLQKGLAIKLFPDIVLALEEKHISISIPDALGKSWQALGWDGSLVKASDDYLMLVEANLGISKANCCIDRSLTDKIFVDKTTATHELTIKYINNNPPKPQPPEQWGGGYKNYLRLLVPKATELIEVKVNDVLVDKKDIDMEVLNDKQSFGFLVLVEGGQQAQVAIRYQVSRGEHNNYSWLFQKQAGIDGWPVQVSIIDDTGKLKSFESGFWKTDTRISN